MMYACEIVASIVAKKMTEEEEKRQAQLAKIAQAMDDFKNHLESIDAYVEKKLIENEGQAYLMIDDYAQLEGFWYFVEKSFSYSSTKPYWTNTRKTKNFPLDIYIDYLREHCFNVEVIECPFTAYSASGKSSMTMKGVTLKISV